MDPVLLIIDVPSNNDYSRYSSNTQYKHHWEVLEIRDLNHVSIVEAMFLQQNWCL